MNKVNRLQRLCEQIIFSLEMSIYSISDVNERARIHNLIRKYREQMNEIVNDQDA